LPLACEKALFERLTTELEPWDSLKRNRSISDCTPVLEKPMMESTTSLNENFLSLLNDTDETLDNSLKPSFSICFCVFKKSPSINREESDTFPLGSIQKYLYYTDIQNIKSLT